MTQSEGLRQNTFEEFVSLFFLNIWASTPFRCLPSCVCLKRDSSGRPTIPSMSEATMKGPVDRSLGRGILWPIRQRPIPSGPPGVTSWWTTFRFRPRRFQKKHLAWFPTRTDYSGVSTTVRVISSEGFPRASASALRTKAKSRWITTSRCAGCRREPKAERKRPPGTCPGSQFVFGLS